MKFTVQDGAMFHICDYSVEDKIDGGFLEEYHPDVKEAVDDILELLSCVYDRSQIADYLLGHIPAMDYATKAKEDD